jgi:predicted alpha/beta superfamily hydrolase
MNRNSFFMSRSRSNAGMFVVFIFIGATAFVGAGCSKREAESRTMSVKSDSVKKRYATGRLIEHKNFKSQFVQPRQIDVWLPSDYDSAKRYAVIYMHDGQNCFDTATSFARIDWGADETISNLAQAGKLTDVIAVGIWNTPNRYGEYMPQKPYESLPQSLRDSMQARYPMAKLVSDDYLKFIVNEVKPFIDSAYATMPERNSTAIMGSSMGGLISLYAMCEYPDVFGKAACLSTHYPATKNAMIEYLKTNLPEPKSHKIYFDFGTESLDAEYEPYQKQVDAVMRQKGFAEAKDENDGASNWMTKKFQGDDHSERAWRKRLHIPLAFLFSKKT